MSEEVGAGRPGTWPVGQAHDEVRRRTRLPFERMAGLLGKTRELDVLTIDSLRQVEVTSELRTALGGHPGGSLGKDFGAVTRLLDAAHRELVLQLSSPSAARLRTDVLAPRGEART